MQEPINFHTFLHKQILVLILLSVATAPGYIFIAGLHGSIVLESLWFGSILAVSLWGYALHKSFLPKTQTSKLEGWVRKTKLFFFIYFSLWNLIFILYVMRSEVELHYIAIATQLGSTIVAATLLAPQKRLARITVASLMLPLVIYFIIVGSYYTYLLAFFSTVLSLVILYSSTNTYNYIYKTEYQAYHDYLTGLPNRRYFMEHLEEGIRNKRFYGKKFYLLLLDLDHFKTINDTLGHDVGDALLRQVTKRMQNYANRSESRVFRLGGDEFCIVSNSYENHAKALDAAMQFAQELLHVIKENYLVQDHNLYISASIGVSILSHSNVDAPTLIKEADIAMYEAKSQGRDGIMLFNDALAKRIERKLDIERLLHFALRQQEITLHYQPQLNAEARVVGCEALVRWHNQELGFIPPDEFISIAENTGIIIELGNYILETAFKEFQKWYEQGIELEQISINISMRQLFYEHFIEDVKHLLHTHLSTHLHKKIIFEITESSVAEDMQKLIQKINILKSLGIRFSMDDFGTGYSSLSYLRQIPLYELKIDRAFISEVANSKQGNLVKTILDIAKNLKLKTVAEGVEQTFQRDFLLQNGCDLFQGYLFAKPLAKEEFVKYLKENI